MFGLFSKKRPEPSLGSQDFAKKILSQAYEAFKLARRDRPREHYQPHGYSGDAAITGSQDLMHRRTRDLIRNTAAGKRIKRVLTNLIVGQGMKTFSWPFMPHEFLESVNELTLLESGNMGPRLKFALESDDLYYEYQDDRKQFDIEGRLAGPEMMRLLIGETITVGNGLMVRVFRKDFDPDKHLVPVCWQMFEREQLNLTLDREAAPGVNRIIGGLELNDLNQVVAYHLWLNHPHDFFGINQTSMSGAGAPISVGEKSVRVAADRVVDLALYDRPSSALGVTWLDASGQSIWDRDSYCESELRTAAVDSVFAFVAKLKDAEKYGGWGFSDGNDDSDESGNREYKVGYSPVASVVGIDESLEMVRPTRPNRDAGHFLKIIDRDIAGAAGVSYYSLTGDYERTNFSSSRAAKLDEELDIQPLQQWFGYAVALPVRRTFNAIAAGSGRFKTIRASKFLKDVRTYQRFDVIGQGRDLLDPYKEEMARENKLRNMLSTFKSQCAKDGKHWIREIIQVSLEKRMFRMFNVEPEYMRPSPGAQSADPAFDTNGSDNAEEIQDILQDWTQ